VLPANAVMVFDPHPETLWPRLNTKPPRSAANPHLPQTRVQLREAQPPLMAWLRAGPLDVLDLPPMLPDIVCSGGKDKSRTNRPLHVSPTTPLCSQTRKEISFRSASASHYLDNSGGSESSRQDFPERLPLTATCAMRPHWRPVPHPRAQRQASSRPRSLLRLEHRPCPSADRMTNTLRRILSDEGRGAFDSIPPDSLI